MDLSLRDFIDSDLDAFFFHELDEDARHMAAFTSKDPTHRAAFDAHWKRIRASESVTIKTITLEGEPVGHIASYLSELGTELTYWIDRAHWGGGIASWAVATFVSGIDALPLYARAAKDNVASIRVLDKAGFRLVAEARGYANARGGEIDEVTMRLDD